MKTSSINGFEDYTVNENGDVFSLKSKRLLKQRVHSKGYLRVSLCKNGISKDFYIHRLVGLHFLDNPNGYKEINHIDGDKTNNHVTNLEWCSRKGNMIHAVKLGFHRCPDLKGEDNGTSKLKENEVNQIRSLYETRNYTQKELGTMFNVSRSNISEIVRYKSWKEKLDE